MYLLGPVWVVAAVVMGVDLSRAPLVYAAVMGGCSALAAANLKALARAENESERSAPP
jgi:hypothetical protein